LRWVQKRAEASAFAERPVKIRESYFYVGLTAGSTFLRLIDDQIFGTIFSALSVGTEEFHLALVSMARDGRKIPDSSWEALIEEHSNADNEPFLRKLENFRDFSRKGETDAAWFSQLRQTIIRYRDIGHDFGLDESDYQPLYQYAAGHGVLIQCLKSERVSPATRAKIEATLFLPAAEV
jgi:hypothetical protein